MNASSPPTSRRRSGRRGNGKDGADFSQAVKTVKVEQGTGKKFEGVDGDSEADTGEVNEYEQQRLKNMERNAAILKVCSPYSVGRLAGLEPRAHT